jgi:transposase
MHVEPWLTTSELAGAIKRQKDATLATRMRGVLLALRGRTSKEAADDLSVAPRSIQTWVQRYNKEGLEGLPDKPRPGQPKRLTPEQESLVAAWLGAGPDLDTDGVVAWRGRVIVEKINRHFKLERTLTLAGAYALMHRLGYEPLRPRPFHPKRDLAGQESFKKDAPLFSRNSAATTPARSSRSGSKTR